MELFVPKTVEKRSACSVFSFDSRDNFNLDTLGDAVRNFVTLLPELHGIKAHIDVQHVHSRIIVYYIALIRNAATVIPGIRRDMIPELRDLDTNNVWIENYRAIETGH